MEPALHELDLPAQDRQRVLQVVGDVGNELLVEPLLLFAGRNVAQRREVDRRTGELDRRCPKLGRDRAAVLAADLDLAPPRPMPRPERGEPGPGQVLAEREVPDPHRQQLVARVPEQRFGGRVDLQVAPFLVGDDDGIRHLGEQTPVARLRGFGSLVEPGLLGGQPGAAAELFGQGQVLRVEATAGLGGEEGDRSDRPPPGDHRHNHRRGQANLAQDRQVLLIAGHRDEHLVGDLRIKLRSPGPQDAGDALRRLGIVGVAILELSRPGDLGGVGVGDGDPGDRTSFADQVDGAPVGQARDDQAGDGGQGRLDLQRRGQHRAGLGQEALPGLRPSLLGNVEDQRDEAPDRPIFPDVRDIGDLDVANPRAGVRDLGLEFDRLPGQRGGDVGTQRRVGRLAQDFAQVPTDVGHTRAEPDRVGAVGEAVPLVGADVGHERGHRVRDQAEQRLAFGRDRHRYRAPGDARRSQPDVHQPALGATRSGRRDDFAHSSAFGRPPRRGAGPPVSRSANLH